MQTESYIESIPFYDILTKPERDLASEHLVIKEYGKGELIHSKDSDCLGLIKVIKGSVLTRMLSAEGREIALYNLKEGDVDVLSASCVVHQITFDTYVVAKEDTKLIILPSACLSKLKENNVFVRCFVYEALSERFSEVMHTFEKILFERLDAKVASFLVERAADSGSNSIFITQEKIAEEINSVREAVARIIRKFVQEELVKTHRGRIEILDLGGLRSYMQCRMAE